MEAMESIIITVAAIIAVVSVVFAVRSLVREQNHRREAETLSRELLTLHERLAKREHADRASTAHVSRNLHAPFSAIKGYASLIEEGSYGAVSPAVREANRRIKESIERMEDAMRVIADTSAADADHVSYRFGVGDVRAVVRDALAAKRAMIAGAGLSQTFTTDDRDTYRANIDSDKLRLALELIVERAIAHTPKGSITVSVERSKRGNDAGGRIRTTITDTGVGMDQADLQRLSDVREDGGGFYVARRYVEAHEGGVLNAESLGKGKGSRYVIELPLA